MSSPAELFVFASNSALQNRKYCTHIGACVCAELFVLYGLPDQMVHSTLFYKLMTFIL